MSSPTKILIIDDAPDDQRIISSALEKIHTVVKAGTLAEAENKLKEHEISLVLLDVHLPDGDGFKFCATIKNADSTRHIPVIFITSRSDVPDKVMGFSLGADDYVAKPFHVAELRARIEAKLKQLEDRRERELILRKGDLKISIPLQRVFVLKNEQESSIDLTPLKFKILFHFAQHEDHVFSRDQLIDAIWGENLNVIDRTVDMHVSNIRKKLAASVFTIKSVHGVGYRFTGPNKAN